MFKSRLVMAKHKDGVVAKLALFDSPLVVEADTDDGLSKDFWFVAAPLIWEDETFGRITVPVGFRTDLASIPRPLRNLPFLDPDGISRRAATIHDFLYYWQVKGKDFADRFLRAGIMADGGSAAVAATFYYAVHWFGGKPWREDGTPAEASKYFEPGDFYAQWLATPDGQAYKPPKV